MVNTDFRMKSMYADIEKVTKGEDLKNQLVDSLDILRRSHAENVGLQASVEPAFFENFDPDPAPGTPRIPVPVPDPEDLELWSHIFQIDQDGNITMEQ